MALVINSSDLLCPNVDCKSVRLRHVGDGSLTCDNCHRQYTDIRISGLQREALGLAKAEERSPGSTERLFRRYEGIGVTINPDTPIVVKAGIKPQCWRVWLLTNFATPTALRYAILDGQSGFLPNDAFAEVKPQTLLGTGQTLTLSCEGGGGSVNYVVYAVAGWPPQELI